MGASESSPRVHLDGRSEFTAALRTALGAAVRDRVRGLCLVDVDYETWPLDDAMVLGLLTDWVRQPKRQLLMLAANFDLMPRRYPRFTDWRGTWAHCIECRTTEVEASQIPSLLLAGRQSLHLADRFRWRGHWLRDDSELAAWREVVEVLIQRSEPDFAVNRLGL